MLVFVSDLTVKHAVGKSENVEDVVSAISARAEIKQQHSIGQSAGRGSAIEQVISDLLLANKNGSSPNPDTTGAGHSLQSSAPLRQSIST